MKKIFKNNRLWRVMARTNHSKMLKTLWTVHNFNRVWPVLTLVTVAWTFQNCGGQMAFAPTTGAATDLSGGQQGGGTTAPSSPSGGNQPPSNQSPICEPFANSTGQATAQNGIEAAISDIPSTSSVISGSGSQLTTASFAPGQPDVHTIPNPVFLNQLSIFDQYFSLGFMTASGQLLTDSNGQLLDQYFSLRIQGLIGLAENQSLGVVTPGNYQFAMLADDGATFSVQTPAGQVQTVINDDGIHPNRFQCGGVVNVTSAALIPYKINYFQGPKYYIGLMLFWRPVDVTVSSALADPLCSNSTNGTTEPDGYFFTDGPNHQPIANANYQAILSRGWSPVPAGNYYLPGGAINPCTQ